MGKTHGRKFFGLGFFSLRSAVSILIIKQKYLAFFKISEKTLFQREDEEKPKNPDNLSADVPKITGSLFSGPKVSMST